MEFNKDVIRFSERLIEEISITWSEYGFVTYISIGKHHYNLLGFIDLCLLVLFNHYIEVDADGKKGTTVVPFNSAIVADVQSSIDLINTDPEVTISFKH